MIFWSWIVIFPMKYMGFPTIPSHQSSYQISLISTKNLSPQIFNINIKPGYQWYGEIGPSVHGENLFKHPQNLDGHGLPWRAPHFKVSMDFTRRRWIYLTVGRRLDWRHPFFRLGTWRKKGHINGHTAVDVSIYLYIIINIYIYIYIYVFIYICMYVVL